MSQRLPADALTQSRLVSELIQLSGRAVALPPRQFADRLGSLIDLSNSVALSATLAGLRRKPFEAIPGGAQRSREDFLKVHSAMVSAVMRSLVPGSGPSRIKWPQAEDGGTAPLAAAYGKFYASHQREMDGRVRGLQERVRDNLMGASPALAELAQLDAALNDALAVHSRQLFSAIPGVVISRAEHLLGSEAGDITPRIRADIQGLLLAEVEARLLPVQGLVEALDEQ